MSRIEPSHFVEVWKCKKQGIQRSFDKPCNISGLKESLFITELGRNETVALFLIAPGTKETVKRKTNDTHN